MVAKVLVVGDSNEQSELQRALIAAGYETQRARGGYEAIRKLRSHAFAVVLTPIHMDDGDGLELLVHARDHQPGIPVIAIANPEDQAYLEAAIGLGASATLQSPISIDDVFCALQTLLALRGRIDR